MAYAQFFISISMLCFASLYCGDDSTEPKAKSSTKLASMWKIGTHGRKKTDEDKTANTQEAPQSAPDDEDEPYECEKNFTVNPQLSGFFGQFLGDLSANEQKKLKKVFYAKPTPKESLNEQEPATYYKERYACKAKTFLHNLMHHMSRYKQHVDSQQEQLQTLHRQELDHFQQRVASTDSSCMQRLSDNQNHYAQMLSQAEGSFNQRLADNKTSYEARLLEARNETKRADEKSFYAVGLAVASLGLAAFIVCRRDAGTTPHNMSSV